MKKFLAFLGLISVSFASVCDKVNLKTHLPAIPSTVKVVSKKEKYGLCEIVLKDSNQYVIIYATKDFVLFGDLIRYGKSETQELLAKLRKEKFKEIRKELDKVVATTYRPVRKPRAVLYFISDPDCPYCNAVKQKVKELADKYGLEIRLVWFPLPFHKGADKKAESFICLRKSFNDYLEDDYGSETCEEGREKIKKSIKLVQELGVNGTPTFFLDDGTMVVGANIKALENAIKRRIGK